MKSIDINIPYVSEKDIDFLIIEEFLSNENFQEIFLKKINFEKITILSINHSLTTIDGESDIVIISRHKELNVGLFIEDKIDAIAMPFQHQRYIERAKKMVEENIIDDYKLFIVAPEAYLNTNYEAKKYENKVSYEKLLEFFNDTESIRYRYKQQLLKTAIEKKDKGYTPIESIAITNFWENYYRFKRMNYSHFLLNEIKGSRGANATWPWFSTKYKDIKIAHKSDKGVIDITINQKSVDLELFQKKVIELLEKDMKLVKTGKSISIRTLVPYINFNETFGIYENSGIMKEIFENIERSYNFLDKLFINNLIEI